jgi:hypothetical protein
MPERDRGPAPRTSTSPVRPSRRLLISAALGALAGLRVFLISRTTTVHRDFAQVWFAAREALAGHDPYASIGPHLAFEWPAPLFYPLPAALAVAPLSPLPELWAVVAFTAIGGACFAWALMQHGYPPLLGFMSASVVFAAELAQFSPILSAALVIAPLSMLWVIKPTIGAAFFLSRPSWWAVAGAALFGGLAFMLQPHWVASWRIALRATDLVGQGHFPYTAPVLMPGGFLALAALLRWRRPEARLVAALACVPQTLLPYEAVPLFLVPRTLRECAIMLALSYAVAAVMPPGNPFTGTRDATDTAMVLLLYLPATLIVLRRPNEGHVPAWLDARIAAWPIWLRGRAISDA